MARNRKRKTSRVTVASEDMKAAVLVVVNTQRPLKTVATECGIDRTTLRRYVKKYMASRTPWHSCQSITPGRYLTLKKKSCWQSIL